MKNQSLYSTIVSLINFHQPKETVYSLDVIGKGVWRLHQKPLYDAASVNIAVTYHQTGKTNLDLFNP